MPPSYSVPAGPTMSTSHTKRLSSFGPTEMPSGGAFIMSARERAADARGALMPSKGAGERARRGGTALAARGRGACSAADE